MCKKIKPYGKGIPVGSFLYHTKIHLIIFKGSLISCDPHFAFQKKKKKRSNQLLGHMKCIFNIIGVITDFV